ncbi:MAG: acyl-CoA thioesterase [Pyrinomonadaceae bacterium]|jgi:acyl-CoA thioester hydrolase|nr:acyl-CoA thioesterase [Pyrinomonadaceae bacterium]
MKFSHSFIVNSNHLDEQNHVNNVVYVQWIQDVAVAHWRNLVSQDIQAKYSWILLRHEIDYKQQSFENDEITSTTWVGKATKVTCERFTEIKRGETLLVKAKSLWCMIDFDTKKPVKISDKIREMFGME